MENEIGLVGVRKVVIVTKRLKADEPIQYEGGSNGPNKL